MKKILFLKGILEEAPWGSKFFKDIKKTDSSLNYGAYVSCKASEKESTIITNGEFAGKKLNDVFHSNRELFNNIPSKEFPLLVKLIKSKEPTSIKVHPNDEYAAIHENSLGKTIGWLVLDVEDDSELIIGVKSKDKASTLDCYNNNKMEELVNIVKPEVGQFFPIYAGTVHGLGKNTLVLEVEESSDASYRIYDYDRPNIKGERDLLVDQALEVITFGSTILQSPNYFNRNEQIVDLWRSPYFDVALLNINKEFVFENPDDYLLCTVASGKISILDRILTLGDSFILTKALDSLTVYGDAKVVLVYPRDI